MAKNAAAASAKRAIALRTAMTIFWVGAFGRVAGALATWSLASGTWMTSVPLGAESSADVDADEGKEDDEDKVVEDEERVSVGVGVLVVELEGEEDADRVELDEVPDVELTLPDDVGVIGTPDTVGRGTSVVAIARAL